MVGSLLGETNKNLQEIFEYAGTAPCVLFFDEFDGVGMERDTGRDIGEMRRITNQLLILLDAISSNCLLVTATNAVGLVDRALERRFDAVIEIPSPSYETRLHCIKRELAVTNTPGFNLENEFESIAKLDHKNLFSLVQFCTRIRRDLALNGGNGVDEIIGKCVRSSDLPTQARVFQDLAVPS